MDLSAHQLVVTTVMLTLMTVLLSLVAGDTPVLERAEPSRVEPYQPVSLQLHGSGFVTGARIFIEGARPGQFVGHAPSSLSAERCEIRLPLGFGVRPPFRRVYVENPDGRQSEALEIRIERAVDLPQADEPAPDAPEEPHARSAPVLEALRPAIVPPGRAFILEILGRGFVENAHVEITVNVNAGTSALPDYRAQRFDAQRLDESFLEVELERGFFPIPGLRDVVVVNPDGGRSPAMSLRIQPMEDER